MRGKWAGFVVVSGVVAAWAATVWASPPPPTLWARQIGTSSDDCAEGIAVDGSGNSHITGYTEADIGGSNQGHSDAFVTKYDTGGTVQWTRQIGSSGDDEGHGIALDGSGNIYITGETSGDLEGSNQGLADAFIVKYDTGGTVQWARQIGTGNRDGAWGVAADGSGNIYIAGETSGDLGGSNQGYSDAFVTKYDSGGTVQWTRQIGTNGADEAHGIALDAGGNIYITGETSGDLAGPNQGYSDTFIAKYDSGGTAQWTRQIGSDDWDDAWDIAVDGSGNSYITGWTYGDLGGPNQGLGDAFIIKCDSGGTVQWTQQIATGGDDMGLGVDVDGGGNIYITGCTTGDLGGPHQGSYDAFVVKCDGSGTVEWARQIGTSGEDDASGIGVDGSGNQYITGWTEGDLGGANQGWTDAFTVAIASYLAAPGDATLDGCVDGLDYIVWSNNYLTGTEWEHGDFIDDDVVDGLDYIAWSNHYLQGCPGTPGQVPEPASALLFALGICALIRRRCKG